MIQINNLRFGYKKAKPIFDGLHFELEGGNICGVLGKNGSGKTTLLRNIAGVLFPQQGLVSVSGNETKHRQADFLADLYYVQEEYQFPDFSLQKYIDVYSAFYPKWDQSKFEHIRSLFEIEENKKIKEYSFGQKKKLLIAFGIATNCRLVILDEPTNGLDIPSKTVFRKALSNYLNDDQCILISTHQVKDVANLLDRVVVIEKGKVLFNKAIHEISSDYAFEYVMGSQLPTDYLYAEPVPGGNVIMSANTNNKSTEVDIEVLFNAIIQNPNFSTIKNVL